MQADSHMVIDMLPAVVQTRLPALRALQKSISRVVPVPRLPRSWPSSARSSPPSSPPLDAVATGEDAAGLDLGLPSSSSSSSSSSVSSIDTVTVNSYRMDATVRQRSGPMVHQRTPSGFLMTPLTPPIQMDESGVKWQYAQQGNMLHALGAQQGGNDSAFIRKSYIDGVSYLLKALPNNLDEHELATIEQSLPTQCLSRGNNAVPDSSVQLYQQQRQQYQQQTEQSQLEVLFRRAIRKAALQFVLLVYLLAKLTTVLVRLAAHYEAKYNISHQVLTHGVAVANAVGHCGMALADKVAPAGDGRLGQALAKAGGWALDIVSGAIQEGLSEGIEVISRRPQPSPRLG
ncbi:uncharacterized protein B0I36DRAFT_362673 [Microdochium trichocladiopsis]|uniref:Uncharacterized protein n=1 Tax=Microdochium trichocladiopsis TaxID=1682393 RepID=A0A9P8Y6I3_9PEZI|nr:uncharacterized protein B0I36DRAFT_362673 [Microdochium trichocladiopsis]KAH7030867.1 hypothetical protein B0I36DRAFT_362673 [Microdochium trichocladiopsis]